MKSWLLALPQFLVVSVLANVLGVLVLIAGVALLFTGGYPRSLFEFILGIDRWIHRVATPRS